VLRCEVDRADAERCEGSVSPSLAARRLMDVYLSE